MNAPARRLNITLDAEHAAKLAQLAERVNVVELLDASALHRALIEVQRAEQ